jgi:hypothetical protein
MDSLGSKRRTRTCSLETIDENKVADLSKVFRSKSTDSAELTFNFSNVFVLNSPTKKYPPVVEPYEMVQEEVEFAEIVIPSPKATRNATTSRNTIPLKQAYASMLMGMKI